MSAAGWREQGVVFDSAGQRLVGILALPDAPADSAVLITVGGPQYRVGSHRQFTLLARELAAQGIASLRFDYTGMGDSEGEAGGFSATDTDLGAALDTLAAALPGLREVVLWGLCDAASSAMMFAHRHPRIGGLVLLNPWVHGDEYSSRVKVSQYYGPLLAGRENWRRLFSGGVRLLPALRDFALSAARVVGGWFGLSGGASRHSFVRQMLEGFERFGGDTLVILSEDDLTASEYRDLLESDRRWRRALQGERVTTCEVAGADHTFSSKAWKAEVVALTADWVRRRQAPSRRPPPGSTPGSADPSD